MKATYYNVSIQHFILDMIGFVPVVGDIVDAVHAVWYAMEGDYWDAAMSAISVLPIIGDMVGVGGKAAVKIGKSIKNGDNIGDIIKSVEKIAGKTGGNAAEKAGSKAAKEAAEEAAEKGTKKTASEAAGGVGKSAKCLNTPQTYLERALKNQGLDSTPNRLKKTRVEGDYKYTVRIHEGNTKYTDADSIYRVSRQSTILDANGQGTGLEYLGTDGNWYHQSVLIEFFKDGTKNPDFNENAARITHIAISGGN